MSSDKIDYCVARLVRARLFIFITRRFPVTVFRSFGGLLRISLLRIIRHGRVTREERRARVKFRYKLGENSCETRTSLKRTFF